MRTFGLIPALAAGAVALFAASCGGATVAKAPASPPALVKSATIDVGGKQDTVLTDGRGFTLYLFKPEKDGRLACLAGCTSMWLPLALPAGASTATAGTALPGKLTTVARPDGSMQLAYNEWPLYTFVNDKAPGSATGEGFANKWFVVELSMPADADGDGDGTQAASPAPMAAQPSSAPAAPAEPAVAQPPAFNDGDGDNRGGPSDGDGNG